MAVNNQCDILGCGSPAVQHLSHGGYVLPLPIVCRRNTVGNSRHDFCVLRLDLLHFHHLIPVPPSVLRKGQSPRKRQAARPEIKTSGLLEHVSLAGTSPLGYHRGVPLGWRDDQLLMS